MRIFTEPKVRVIARPRLDRENIAAFLKEETDDPQGWIQEDPGMVTDGDSLPEFCGRMCYVSFGAKQGKRTNESYIGNIIEQGHGSVLEHSNWTFLVTGASRGFTHEMVRHRSGFAYSQESTHYIDYSKQENWTLCLDPRLVEGHKNAMIEAAEAGYREYARIYETLRGNGTPKKEACSMARQVLPTGIESKLCFTANARALRHFIEYRGHAGNVLEIRQVAIEVLKIMRQEAYSIFKDITFEMAPDGFPEAVSGHRKV